MGIEIQDIYPRPPRLTHTHTRTRTHSHTHIYTCARTHTHTHACERPDSFVWAGLALKIRWGTRNTLCGCQHWVWGHCKLRMEGCNIVTSWRSVSGASDISLQLARGGIGQSPSSAVHPGWLGGAYVDIFQEAIHANKKHTHESETTPPVLVENCCSFQGYYVPGLLTKILVETLKKIGWIRWR